MESPIVQVSHVSIRIQQNEILHDVNFVANEQETIAIIGPNGAGKTTLFKALLGLIPYQGVIRWKDKIKIGYVPQKFYIEDLFPLTIEEFFKLKEKNKNEIYRVLSKVGFDVDEKKKVQPFIQKRIGLLSGGEIQKILIAWALIGHPDVLLFDEPTSGIDVSSEGTIYSLLHRLQQDEHLTIILISHELQIVYRYATNVICLNKQSICFGSPKEVMDKENLYKTFGSDVGFYQHHT